LDFSSDLRLDDTDLHLDSVAATFVSDPLPFPQPFVHSQTVFVAFPLYEIRNSNDIAFLETFEPMSALFVSL
jgi:hypothetical protein